MVERFNGKIKAKVFKRYLFPTITDLNLKLMGYVNQYNFVVKLKQLGVPNSCRIFKINI